jgi:hypothetical protein
MEEDEERLSQEDALDFFYFQTVNAYVGEKTPIFIKRYE